MITVDQALSLVLEHARPQPPVAVPVVDAAGLILAEDVASDIDSPPHDKAMVDGYAVVAADLSNGQAELAILEEVTAGAVPTLPVAIGHATRIMTGAPVPDGADAVVMIERTELAGVDRVRIRDDRVRSGLNIMRRGTSLRRDEIVLKSGNQIRPIEIGLLSEVGRVSISARPRPGVAVLSTGNELVSPGEKPGAGEIRNSNGPMLDALAVQAGAVPVNLGVGADKAAELERLVRQGLQQDVLVLSGGVSAGVLDLVPQVLERCGVTQVFHKVKLKPGKPIWFGVKDDAESHCLVFGLPGNPVSSLVCFELFVRPAIASLAGDPGPDVRRLTAVLANDFAHRGDRPTWHPAVITDRDEQRVVRTLSWQGSADLRTLADANGLACFPAGDRHYAAGERVDVTCLGPST